MVNDQTLKMIVKHGLNFLKEKQVKSTIPFRPYKRFLEEWPSYMINLTDFPLLGAKGKGAYDSNNFTTVTIHNLLAKIYLENPKLESIPPMLDLVEKQRQQKTQENLLSNR